MTRNWIDFFFNYLTSCKETVYIPCLFSSTETRSRGQQLIAKSACPTSVLPSVKWRPLSRPGWQTPGAVAKQLKTISPSVCKKPVYFWFSAVSLCVHVSVECTPPPLFFSVSQTHIGFWLNKLSALCTLKEVHLPCRVLGSLQAAWEINAKMYGSPLITV